MKERTYIGINKNRKDLVDAIFDKGTKFEGYQSIELGGIGWEQAAKNPYFNSTAQNVKRALYGNDSAKLTCNVKDGTCHVGVTSSEYYFFKSDVEFLRKALEKQLEPKPRAERPRPSALSSVPVEPYAGKMDAERIERYYEQKGWVREFGHLRKYVDNDVLRIVTSKVSFRVERGTKTGGKIDWRHYGGGYYKDFYINEKGILTKYKTKNVKKTMSSKPSKKMSLKEREANRLLRELVAAEESEKGMFDHPASDEAYEILVNYIVDNVDDIEDFNRFVTKIENYYKSKLEKPRSKEVVKKSSEMRKGESITEYIRRELRPLVERARERERQREITDKYRDALQKRAKSGDKTAAEMLEMERYHEESEREERRSRRQMAKIKRDNLSNRNIEKKSE